MPVQVGGSVLHGVTHRIAVILVEDDGHDLGEQLVHHPVAEQFGGEFGLGKGLVEVDGEKAFEDILVQ